MARTTPRRTTPPPGSSTFCYWVKRWRSYQGVTQRRFSELWGVSLSLVQKIEANDYSVSQLSFERLEALRTLLQLPSSTFYGLIATHPDKATEHGKNELVQVERLEPGLPPVSLPQVLLGNATGEQLGAFALAPSDFASDRLRYRLNIGTLIVFDKVQTPRNDDLCVALTRCSSQTYRVLHNVLHEGSVSYRGSANAVTLRPFDPEGVASELYPDDLEPLGVVTAYWVNLLN